MNTIYTQTGERIAKMAKTFDFAMVKVTPAGIVIPPIIGSFVAYLTTDLGMDAFVLPLPTMR